MRKLEEHKRRYERLQKDREMKQRQKRAQKAREEHEKAAGGNRPGAGATPGGKGDFLPPEFLDLFSDPEIQKCMEVSIYRREGPGWMKIQINRRFDASTCTPI